jgi:hypothetical protein
MAQALFEEGDVQGRIVVIVVTAGVPARIGLESPVACPLHHHVVMAGEAEVPPYGHSPLRHQVFLMTTDAVEGVDVLESGRPPWVIEDLPGVRILPKLRFVAANTIGVWN